MSEEKLGFVNEYSDEGFWDKVITYAKVAGKDVVEKALLLYYAAQNRQTPAWAKAICFGALGYFIFPLDAIPDLTPVVGYADDFGVLVAAVATIAKYITDDVNALADQKLKDLFGD